MKVKVNLKFRGREMAHTEFGFQVVTKFLDQIAPYGHPDFQPKLAGRNISVMVSPLPRSKRGKGPRENDGTAPAANERRVENNNNADPVETELPPRRQTIGEPNQGSFVNNPFAQLEVER